MPTQKGRLRSFFKFIFEKHKHNILLVSSIFLILNNEKTPSIVLSQTLPIDELNSAIFLINQYGYQIPQNDSLCNFDISSNKVFRCSSKSGQWHIDQIYSEYTIYTNVGIPDHTLKSLTFPALNLFQLWGTSATNLSINLLDLFMESSYPLLNTFTVTNCRVFRIPDNFAANMPVVQNLQLRLPDVTTFGSFFPTPNLGLVIVTGNFTKAPLMGSMIYPKLDGLMFTYNPISDTINLPKSQFPLLRVLEISITTGSQLDIFTDTPISVVGCMGTPRETSNIGCSMHLTDISKVRQIVSHGKFSTFSPMIDSTFKVLEVLIFAFGSRTTYPFPLDSIPPIVTLISMEGNQMTSIPQVQLPSTVKDFSLHGNPIVGPIDFDYLFENNTNMALRVNSNQVTGTVPDSFCDNRLNIYGTLITAIPDCFWCYYGDQNILSTSIPKPVNFVCKPAFDSTLLVTRNGKVTGTGRLLGWGFLPNIKAIIPNRQMEITYPNYVLLEPPKTVSFSLSSVVSVQTDIVEAGVYISDVKFVQQATTIQVIVGMYNYNPYFAPSAKLEQVDYLYSTCNKTMITFSVPPMPSGVYYAFIANQYFNASLPRSYSQTYPTVTNISKLSAPGINITIFGKTGGFANSVIQVTFNNGTLSETDCQVIDYTSTYIICSTPFGQPGVYGNTSVRVNVNGFFTFSSVVLKSIQSYCQETTNYCHGNGDCNESGICLCKQSNFYDSCSKSYPTLSSGQYDSNDLTMVSLYGDFGPLPTLTNVSIKLNNSISCTPTIVSQSSINCTLSSIAPFGLSSAQVSVDDFNTSSPNILVNMNSGNSTTPSSSSDENHTGESAQQKCSRLTFNCFGNGICDTNGICVCNQNYNPIDHCFTKFINTTIIANSTSPTVSFDVDGLDFQFEFKSIQELDLDNNVLNLLNIDDYSWNVNVSINDIITTAVYQLNTTNTTNSNNSTSQFNPFQSLQVTSTISFSSQERVIPFGDQSLVINPNSIKLAINVSGWQYSSNVATLRLIFTSVVNQNQSIEFNCEKTEIGTLSFDSLSNLQYLRVVKDNIQFNGRFIDYAISDGRVVYSQTELVSFTPIDDKDNDNDGQSIATIGIRLPQCQECLLDPDFTPLLIDKSNDQGCGESSSKAWKIAVGVVVGAGAAIAIASAALIFHRKKLRAGIYQSKLDRASTSMRSMG
ncbi:hypothetical protein DFA_09178 [Cavenderia fasciculata]|uniref:ComC supersandwich domain-containing protein n=1 Tax=Cavenderia fasciculata TaxID=261658 RepID=F4Q6X1_CACFS|nr:uncharacterized protein DFA_09178 [Cavenderia fasciculata]EGG16153.1 hypothetical protein DFA_09178 [Cavenderia fasciculata]|eukprot:XP_004352606.1 hypothetical protein DFA_09178 [Cavenderia fasciculata]